MEPTASIILIGFIMTPASGQDVQCVSPEYVEFLHHHGFTCADKLHKCSRNGQSSHAL